MKPQTPLLSHRPIRALLFGILLASQVYACTSPDFVWGATVDGLRIGLRVDEACGNKLLRLRFQNTGHSSMELFIGGQSGNRIDYHHVTFTARATTGRQCPVLYPQMSQPADGVGPAPFFITLAAGEQYDFNKPRKEFYCFKGAEEVSLDQLLAEGFTIQASLDVPPIARGIRPNVWIGTVSSGIAKGK